MEKRISEKDCSIIYSIRKNCRFRYENDLIDNTYDTYGTIDFVPLEEDDKRFNKGKKLLYIGW